VLVDVAGIVVSSGYALVASVVLGRHPGLSAGAWPSGAAGSLAICLLAAAWLVGYGVWALF